MLVLVWVGIAVALVVLAALAVWRARDAQHDASAADGPLRRELQAAGRELTPGQRARYLDTWRRVEATFAGDPEAGLARADHVLRQLAAELGFGFERLERDAHFGEAAAVVSENERRAVRPRQLQRAMRAYRTRFAQLIVADERERAAVTRRAPVGARSSETRE